MKLNMNRGDLVDLVTEHGRQRAVVVSPPTGKRGLGAMVRLRVTSKGYFSGRVDALQAQVTPRLNRKYMA